MSAESNIARQRAAGRRDGGPAYQARRMAIVEAAAAVFKERGYHGTTLAEVAEWMGSDRASLYYYVSGKQELFEDLVSDAVQVCLTREIAVRDGPGSGAERLRRLVGTVMESCEEFYPVLYVLLQENLDQLEPSRRDWGERMAQMLRDTEQVVADIVLAGQADGTIDAEPPCWLITRGVVGMLAWTSRWYEPASSRLPAGDIGDVFARILLDGLGRTDGAQAG